MLNIISILFYQILYMTIIGSAVGILVYFVRKIFDNKISGKWKCIMWGIVLITLIIPIRFEIKTDKSIIQNEFVNRVEFVKEIPTDNYYSIPEEPQEKENISNDMVTTENSSVTSNEKASISLKNLIIKIAIPVIWFLGVLSLLVSFIVGIIKIKNKINPKTYVNEEIEKILLDCKNQLNIKKNIKLVVQNYKRVPSIFGIFSPIILITEKLALEHQQTIKYIFLHELSHYKRKDLLFNYILLFILSIHWFNPVVWFLFKKIRQDIEIGADELATKNLNSLEKKEYSLVLINLLRNGIRENYTANMLCMSDTGKNMERRIKMIKGKSKNIFVSMILVTIILALVVSFVFIKNENNDGVVDSNNKGNISSNDKGNNTIIDEVMELTNEERIAIENYTNELCNTMFCRIPEFEDINNADKEWIYAHLKLASAAFDATAEEIENSLKNFFGSELDISVKEDQKLIDPQIFSMIPWYVEQEDKYVLPRTSSDNVIHYAINKITKTNENYVVNVIEFSRNYDLLNDEEGKETIICTYDASINNPFKWREVFRIETDKLQEAPNNFIPSTTLVSEVLKRKEEFLAYDITIKKAENGNFTVQKIESAGINNEKN